MRPGAGLLATAGCVALAAAALWHGWSTDTARPAAIMVVAGSSAAHKPAPPLPKSSPPVIAETPVPNAPTTERAESVITDFAAHASAPLAIESSTCSGSRCRVAVYQTDDYVQRGRKFYESEDFTALTRAAGAQAVRVTPYDRPDRSGYLIDMMF
ncbi:hypothetical protein KV697_08935 [Sphingomonas sanguinis]|uniref:hypothetical protein n=1 Tax=Sphingomonas sanguinis TaxID=33051 RepID=UPI001C582003|nr:hypothetical protein [Sphingomonas sanguinis]QXT37371.1 hypothetical protein KV697_08935 [Sphingomonas sanguinis]